MISRIKELLDGTLHDRLNALENALGMTRADLSGKLEQHRAEAEKNLHLAKAELRSALPVALPVELQGKFLLAKEELQRTLAEMAHISRAYSSGEATKAAQRIRETIEKL
jgi:uncharacterized protein YqfA (UPF0365 family)